MRSCRKLGVVSNSSAAFASPAECRCIRPSRSPANAAWDVSRHCPPSSNCASSLQKSPGRYSIVKYPCCGRFSLTARHRRWQEFTHIFQVCLPRSSCAYWVGKPILLHFQFAQCRMLDGENVVAIFHSINLAGDPAGERSVAMGWRFGRTTPSPLPKQFQQRSVKKMVRPGSSVIHVLNSNR